MKNAFYMVFRTIRMFLTPAPYRGIFFGQVRCAVYLEGGQVVKFNCTNFKFNLSNGSKSYEFKGLTDMVVFDTSKIIGAKEISWF